MAGRAVLEAGGSAVDAVEAAIRELEDDPTFDAGYGSALNEDGEVEMCSAIMEGRKFDVGAVSVIQGVRHPISVARAMLDEEVIFLSGPGARRFAKSKGLELCDAEELIPPNQNQAVKKGTHDTVVASHSTKAGQLAVGTSTGGLDDSPPGRVGDFPQPGCGYYADASIGAVALSGDGEHIARKMLAARIIHLLPGSEPEIALQVALTEVAAIGGEAGGIVLMPDGRFGWDHNSRDFAIALQSSADREPRVHTRKQEGFL